MQGFKSFADETSMLFDDGVTAIVGPNGCGKSNVSDAVRWVLGEQRARVLRGAKMEEVIFQGSSARRAVNVSEVSLVFANDEGVLPTPFREVVVTRRLSRSGESDYLLNGAPCRLRDIHDLMRGTGLGTDAGVVIEQRMIDALLSDRPDAPTGGDDAGPGPPRRPAGRSPEPGPFPVAPAQARRAAFGADDAPFRGGPDAGLARHGVVA
jgi:chromosome segregation protein